MENNEKAELLTAKKISEAIGVSEAKVKKAITELNIAPDSMKGKCNYYGPETVVKIKEALS